MSTGTLTDSLRETLAVFEDTTDPLTTPEVADRLDIGRRSTYARLERLVEADRLATKKVGANARVWWTPRGDTPTTAAEGEFRSLVEAIEEYAIYTLDAEGRIRTWNPGAERITGYPAEDIFGEHVSVLYTAEDVAAGTPERTLEWAAADGTVTEERRRVRADGSRFWATVTITAMREADGTLAGFATVARDMTERREYERRLEAQAERLERQRSDLESELDEVFDRISDGFYALDDDLRFKYVNDHAVDLLELDAAAVGADIREAVPLTDAFEAALCAAIETQESVILEDYYPPLDAWFSNAIYPSESGLSVYFRDVTARVERERDRALYETIVETIHDGIYVLDEDDRFAEVNDAYLAMTGYDRETLLGAHCSLVVDDAVAAEAASLAEKLAAGDVDVAAIEADLTRADGSQLRAESNFAVLPRERTKGIRRVGVVRDVSDRVDRERELERVRDFFTEAERLGNLGAWEVDAGGPITWTAGTRRIHAVDDDYEPSYPAALAFFHPEDRATIDEAVATALADGEPYEIEARLVTADGEERWVRTHGKRVDDRTLRGFIQDITDHVERERALREANAQLEAATAAGEVGTFTWDVEADRMVTGAWLAETFGVTPAGAEDGVPLAAFIEAIHEDDRDRITAAVDAAVADCGEYEAEYRVRNAADDVRWVVARGHVECDENGDPTRFPGALVDITDRKRAEIALERQRAQLAATNSLNRVVHDITDAVIDQSTREEIEQTVCERLAASDSYAAAWIGEVDPADETVVVRTAAGDGDAFTDVTITVDPDDERSDCPPARALQTGEMQTVQDVGDDQDGDPWQAGLVPAGARSAAAIPIANEDVVYGVLTVYAARSHAFEGQEGELIAQLGEVVGHAIAAAERKRALMSDDLVELAFRINDVYATWDVPDPTTGTITFDRAVPAGDDEYIVYGTATPDALATVTALGETLPYSSRVTIRSEDDPARFEARVTDPPVLSVVAQLGGSVETAVVEDGDYRLTIHLPPGVDVRRVIEAVEGAYPRAEMVRRQQITRPTDDVRRLQRRLAGDLTDRQRTALDAAYHAGYFAWPRETAGEDLAASLGVSPSTFHQHLRTAERKVLEAVYAGDDANADTE